MIRVTVESQLNRQIDLLPEHMTMSDVLGHFHLAAAVNSVEGAILKEEDLDRCLREFSENSDVCIISCSKSAEEFGEVSLAVPDETGDQGKKKQLAAEKVRKLLAEALTILDTVLKPSEEDLPF